jgi:hypothetical protein
VVLIKEWSFGANGVSSGREMGNVGPLDNLRLGDFDNSSSTGAAKTGESILAASIDARYAKSVFWISTLTRRRKGMLSWGRSS